MVMHVLVPLAVDLVEHGREGRGLAGAGGAGDEHEAARLVADRGDHRGQAQLLEAADLVGDRPVDGGHRAPLHEDVGAEAGEALDAEAEVELQRLLEAVLLGVGEHAVGELLGLDRGEGRQVQGPELAVHADLRRGVGGDVEVGASDISVIVLSKLVQADGHVPLLGPGPFERRRAGSSCSEHGLPEHFFDGGDAALDLLERRSCAG